MARSLDDFEDFSSMPDEEDLTRKGPTSRESVRQRLASTGHNLDNLDSNNLLVCFLNEEASDDESGSDHVAGWLSTKDESTDFQTTNLMCMEKLSSKTLAKNNISKRKGQIIIPLSKPLNHSDSSDEQSETEENPIFKEGPPSDEKIFFEQLAAIQIEARKKLRDAKFLAERTVESERKNQQMNSEIHKMLGLRPGSRLSRSVLTPMTVGQLQFILNYLLSQIETLNEDLVQFLIARDELAIEQDSLLTDIEDITKCIGGVKQSLDGSII